MSRLLAAVAVLVFAIPASAARHVWTGAVSAKFSDAGNWTAGSPAGDADAELSFPSGVERVGLNNDVASLTVRAIAFSGPGYSIAGNTITLAPGGVILDSSFGPTSVACNVVLEGGATIVASGTAEYGGGLTLGGAISGFGPVIKRGLGALTFSGNAANTYTGSTTVGEGELRMAKRAFATAVPGDLTLVRSPYFIERASATTLASEQIADTATVRVADTTELYIAGIETVGPLELGRGAVIETKTRDAWNFYSGMLVLGGDITITGSSWQQVTYLSGHFVLPATRTITFDGECCGGVRIESLHGNTPNAGVIIRGTPDSRSYLIGDYTGPTTIEQADVVMINASSPATLRGGRFYGSAASLAANSGTVLTADVVGDLRIGAEATFAPEYFLSGAQPLLRAGGTIRLGGTLDLSDVDLPVAPGRIYPIVENRGAFPIYGAFSNMAEGAAGPFGLKASYVAGDGNDVTLTDTRRYSSHVSLNVYGQLVRGAPVTLLADVRTNEDGYGFYQATGPVTFRDGANVIGTASINVYGTALITVVLQTTGLHTFTAQHASTATVNGGEDSVTIEVAPPPATLTSIDPASVRAGETVTLTAIGTEFDQSSKIVVNEIALATTFLSSTELHAAWQVPPYEFNTSATVHVFTPPANYQRTASKTIAITGVRSDLTNLSWETSAVSGPVTPGAQSVWLRGSRRTVGFSSRRETQFGEVLDSDHDGIVRWALAEAIPPISLFLMIDVQTGTLNVGSRVGRIPQPVPFASFFVRGTGGAISNVQFSGDGSHDLMWVRPGVGAWRMSGGGYATWVETSSAIPLYGTTPPPAGIEPGDVVAALYNAPDSWYGGVVDEHIHTGPGILLFDSSVSLPVQEDAAVAKLRVVRVSGADGAVSVNYTTVDDSAIAGVQYQATAGTLTFAEGELEKWIEVPIIDDSVYSGSTRFSVRLSDPVDATLGNLIERPVLITDADAPPSVSIGPDVTMAEGDGDVRQTTFTVSLSNASRLPVTLSWFTVENFVSTVEERLVFAPGDTEKSITVSFRGDDKPGADRAITVQLRLDYNAPATLARGSTQLTVLDDDELVGVTILDTSVNEAAGTASVTISVTEYSERPITVSYGTESLTAHSGRDYTRVRGTITLQEGATVEVPIVNDSVAENDEAFLIVLSNPAGGRLLRSSAVVVITDDDPVDTPTLWIDAASVQERRSEPAMLRIPIRLSQPAERTVSFYARTIDGSATSGSDYNAIGIWGSINPGHTSTSVTVEVRDDTLSEPTEWFKVELIEISNAVAPVTQAVATIYDDDTLQPTLTIDPAEVFEGNDGVTAARFALRLTNPGTQTVTVSWQTANDTATAGSDYQTASGQVTFAPAETVKTVSVNVLGDTAIEPDETFNVQIISATNATVGRASAPCTIRNDDYGPKDGRR